MEEDLSYLPQSSAPSTQESPAGRALDRFELSLSGRHEGLQRLRKWVVENDASSLRLDRAAAIACLEPHYFSRIFHELVGQSFKEWRHQLRMTLALKAIESGRHSIYEAMHIAGYRDRRAFERAIRRLSGTTPGCIRRGSVRTSF